MKWNTTQFSWKRIACCIIGVITLSNTAMAQDSCKGKAGERLKPGTYTFEVCVPAGKCVANYDENAYCSKAQSSCTSKSPDCDYSSACYSLPDGDNKGVTSAFVVGAACVIHVGKASKAGVLCKFTTTVAAGGHLDCHCECGQNIPVPSAIAFEQRQELAGLVEKNALKKHIRNHKIVPSRPKSVWKITALRKSRSFGSILKANEYSTDLYYPISPMFYRPSLNVRW